jgi:hypothetical protein
MTKARRNAIWTIASAFLALGAVGVVVARRPGEWDTALFEAHLHYLEHVPPLFWPRDTFSPEAWKQTPPDGRYRLVKSLVSKEQLKGRTPSEVDRLVGGMRADRLSCLDQVGANEGRCPYLLRKLGFQNLWWELELEFKSGRVIEVRRRMAWID